MRDRELFLSVMTLGEIRKGINRLAVRDISQSSALESWLDEVTRSFGERVIDISLPVADRWGRLQAIRSVPEIDALLAASALEHDLTLVTRNEADFEGLGVRILNPFSRCSTG